MKNMYLAAAMVVSLAFSACSDEESGKADRAYKPIEIFGNINEVVNNVQETRAVGAAWGSDDRRGITLTEMLCTVLIVLLLTALLVVGIRFAGKTYTESMRLSEAQELCSTLTSVISDKLRFCGTVTQDENGGLTQIFIQNVGSVEGKGDAFQIGEDGQLALGDRHLLGSASYPKGLQVTAFTLRYDASTDIFSVTLEIGDRFRQTLSRTSFEVKRINRTVT